MSDHLINTQMGVYRLVAMIGRGGMATVYKAYQPGLSRYVAVKVLPRTDDPEFTLRFEQEAQTAARLQHPNILNIHDYGEQDGLLYLVLPYIENSASLSDLLAAPLAPTRAAADRRSARRARLCARARHRASRYQALERAAHHAYLADAG